MTVGFLSKMLQPETMVTKYPVNYDPIEIHRARDLINDQEIVTDFWFDDTGLNVGVQR